MFVVGLGQLERAAERRLDLGDEGVLGVGRVVAPGQRGDEGAHQRRALLVAGRLARRQQVVQQEGQRRRLLGHQVAHLGRERVLGHEARAAGVRAHQFGQ